MGRKKILIKTIQDERLRNITFNKRKAGLLKKAAELSMLCDIKVCLAFTDVYGNLINFFSPDCNVINDFKNVEPYKRIYSFTREDYPNFFGSKKKNGNGDEANTMNDLEGQNISSSEDDDKIATEQQIDQQDNIKKEPGSGQLKQNGLNQQQQQQQQLKQPKLKQQLGLQIKIPEKNQHIAKEIQNLQMKYGQNQQQNKELGTPQFITKQEQDTQPLGYLFQKSQQDQNGNLPNYQNPLSNFPSHLGNYSNNNHVKQDLEYNLKSNAIDSSNNQNSSKNSSNFNPADKEFIVSLVQQVSQQQQELKQAQQQFQMYKEMELQKLSRSQLNSVNNIDDDKKQYSQQNKNQNNNHHQDIFQNLTKEQLQQIVQQQLASNNQYNQNNNQKQNLEFLKQQQQQQQQQNNKGLNMDYIQFQQHQQNQQNQNLFANLAAPSSNPGMLPPSSNPLFQGLGSNGGGPGQASVNGFNFLNSLGDGQGRQQYQQLQFDNIINPTSNNNQSQHFYNQINNINHSASLFQQQYNKQNNDQNDTDKNTNKEQ